MFVYLICSLDISSNNNTLLATAICNMQCGNINQDMPLWLKKQAVYSTLLNDTSLTLCTALQNFKDSIALTDMGELEGVREKIKDNDLQNAKLQNDAIMPSNAVEFTTKDVYSILIRSFIDNRTANELTTDEVDTLRYVAYLCPIIYGKSVYSARAICTYLDTAYVDYSNSCEQTPISASARLAKAEQKGISIYPNPVKEQVNIQADLGENEQAELQIIDVKGQVMESYPIYNQQEITLNLKHLPNSLYLCRVISIN